MARELLRALPTGQAGASSSRRDERGFPSVIYGMPKLDA